MVAAAIDLVSGLEAVSQTSTPQGTSERASAANGISPSVSPFNGSLSTAYPIEVPPGRGAVTPALALVYNSSRGNGFCGMGWGLDVPHIERVGEKNSLATYGNTDKFVLSMNGSGGDLIRIGQSSIYRTETESFMELEYKVDGTKDFFEAKDANGITYRFGYDDNSRIRNIDQNEAKKSYVWYLDRVTDFAGNSCDYQCNYSSQYVNRGILQKVEWGKTEGVSGSQSLYKVDVEYDVTRTDNISNFRRTQFGELINYRVSGIVVSHKVQGNWITLWRYNLGYEISPTTGRSRLIEIRKMTPEGADYMPKAKFKYSDKTSGWDGALTPKVLDVSGAEMLVSNLKYPYSVQKWEVNESNYSADHVYDKGVRFLDLNGDGLTDILVSRVKFKADPYEFDNGVEHRVNVVFLNQGVEAGTERVIFREQSQATWNIPVDVVGIVATDVRADIPGPVDVTIDYGVRFGDINGDTRPDIVVMRNHGILGRGGTSFDAAYFYGDAVRHIYMAKPEGGWNTTGTPWEFPGGEGNLDVVFVYSYAYQLPFSSDGRFNPEYYSGWRNVDVGVQMADMNGDGKDDLILSRDGERKIYRNTGTGWVWESVWKIPKEFTKASIQQDDEWYPDQSRDMGIRLADMNGDGLVDIVESVKSNYAVQNPATKKQSVHYNNGKGWGETPATEWSHPIPEFVWSILGQGESFYTQDSGTRLADVNGDGSADILQKVYISNSSSELVKNCKSINPNWQDISWNVPVRFGYNVGNSSPSGGPGGGVFIDEGVRFADLNGDGLIDLIQTLEQRNRSRSNEDIMSIWLSKPSVPDLLTEITSPQGIITKVEYKASTAYKNSYLPMVLQTVSAVKRYFIDPATNLRVDVTHPGEKHLYVGGLWDTAEREFRGFNLVRVTPTLNGTDTISGATETWFHQGKEKAGKPIKSAVYNATGMKISETEMTYADDISAPYFTPVIEQKVMQDGVSKTTLMPFLDYNLDNGQPQKVIEKNIPAWNGTSITFRDRITTTTFAYKNPDYETTLKAERRFSESYLSSVYDGFISDETLLARKETVYENQVVGSVSRLLSKYERVFDKDRGNWIRSNTVVARDEYMTPIESEDVDGNHTVTKLGHQKRFPIATVVNATQAETVVDDFNDGGLTDASPESWSADAGWFVNSAGELQAPQNQSKCHYSGAFPHQTNFIAEFDIKIGESPDAANWGGLHFRKSDNSSAWTGYILLLRQNGSLELVQTNPVQVIATKALGGGIGVWHRIRLLAEDREDTGEKIITVFADGVKAFSVNVDGRNGSYLCFEAYNAQTTIDNVRIYPADAYCTSQSMNAQTLLPVSATDVDGISGFTDYDNKRRPIRTRNHDGRILSEQSYFYSRDGNTDSNYDPAKPNYTRTVSYTDGKDLNGTIYGTTPATVSRTYSDALGRAFQTQVQDGTFDIISRSEYDGLGRPYKAWRPFRANNSSHEYYRVGEGQPNFTLTEYSADPLSRKVKVTPIDGNSDDAVEMSYFNATDVVSGALCQVTETKSPFENGSTKTRAQVFTDAWGRTLKTISNVDGNGSERQFSTSVYDILDRPVKSVAPNGFSESGYPDGTFQTTMSYTFLGKLKEATSPDAGTKRFVYDKAGRVRFSQDAEQASTANGKLEQFSYFIYDYLGRLVEEGYGYGSWNTPSGTANRTYFEDKADNDRNWPPTPPSWRKRYIYDNVGEQAYSKGNLAQVLTNSDDDIFYEIEESIVTDKYGRITAKTLREWDYSPLAYTTRYEYDLSGNVLKVIYPSASNPAGTGGESGTTTVEAQTVESGEVKSYDGTSIQTSGNVVVQSGGTLNLQGRERVILTPGFQAQGGGKVSVTATGTVGAGMEVVYRYNALGQLISVGTPADLTYFGEYYYRDTGELELNFHKRAGTNGAEQIYDYDSRGRLEYISGNFFDEVLRYEGYGYGGVGYRNGNIASVEFKYFGQNAPVEYQYQMKYDRMGRLKVADCQSGDGLSANADFGIGGEASYDRNGNFLSVKKGANSSTSTYLYQAGTNRVTGIQTGGFGSTGYGYNANGAVTFSPKLFGGAEYDAHTRMTTEASAVIFGLGNLNEYGYDAADARVLKVRHEEAGYNSRIAERTLYLHGLSDYPLAEKRRNEASGAESETKYIYGLGGLICTIDGSGTESYMLKDHLGSTRVVIGTDGIVKASYDYSAFGSVWRQRGGWGSSYLYTGQERDSELSLYNYRARMYDEDLMRFYDTDPADEQFSPYAFVGNSPMMFTDPTGALIDPIFTSLLASLIAKAQAVAAQVAAYATAAAATTVAATEAAAQTASDIPTRFINNDGKIYDAMKYPYGSNVVFDGYNFISDGDGRWMKLPMQNWSYEAIYDAEQMSGILRNVSTLLAPIEVGLETPLLDPVDFIAPSVGKMAIGVGKAATSGVAKAVFGGVVASTYTLALNSVAKGTAKQLSVSAVHEFSNAASLVLNSKNGLTVAGRALQKHGVRTPNAFPDPGGTMGNISQAAQSYVDDILTHPGSVFIETTRPRFGQVIEVIAPDGRGVRFNSLKQFIGFLQP